MSQFNEVAELHEQAYQAFSRMDAREHPAPLAPRWYQTFNFTMVIYAVALASSMALSSLSTGSVVSDSAQHFLGLELATVEAVLSVLTLELVFSGTRFVMIFTAYKLRSEIPDSQAWMKVGFWLSFAMILLTNLYFRLGKLPDMNPDLKSLMDVILGFMLAVAVPVMAFVAGDVLAILYITGDKARVALVADFNAKMTAYVEGRQRRWVAKKKDFGIGARLENAVARLSASEQTDNRQTSTSSVRKPSDRQTDTDKIGLVVWYLRQHPDSANQTVRQLSVEMREAGYEVGHDTAAKGRKVYLARLSASEQTEDTQ